jgi:hypothetical protein
MNEAATIEPAIPAPVPPAPPPVVVPERAEPILGALASARDITLRHLRRIDRVAEEMAPEDLKVALAEDGQMTLNLTRADRALRQICAMELEIMGLREPPVPRGPASGTRGNGGNGRTGRNDFNDLNDLNDMQDIEDLEALDALYDFDDPEDVSHYDDLDALEKYDTFETYERERPHRRENTQEDEDALLQRIDEVIAETDWSKVPPIADEDRYQHMKDFEAELRADLDAHNARDEAIWSQRRAALLKLRATQKRLRRKSRGPPGG